MKKSIVVISVAIISVLISYASISALYNYRKKVNETAFSLCANVILSNSDSKDAAKIAKNYLTFSDLREREKEILVAALRNNISGIKSIAQKMELFDYNAANIKELEKSIREFESIEAIKLFNKGTSEELAERLVNDVFDGVKFKLELGDGENFIKRYYCSNVCIDACKDGVVKYLSNIEPESGEDLFLNWLLEKEDAAIVSSEQMLGMKFVEISGNNVNAALCIEMDTKRVIMAEITLKCYNE